MTDQIPTKDMISVKVLVSKKQNKPVVEIRRYISNLDEVKTIISCAFHSQPMMILPEFNDRIKTLRQLQHVGLVFYNKETHQFEYTI